MFAGVSTACFYPELLEKALDYLVRHGVANTEVFFNAPSELEEPYVRRLAETARAGGTVIRSVHPFTSGLEPLLFFPATAGGLRMGLSSISGFSMPPICWGQPSWCPMGTGGVPPSPGGGISTCLGS